MHLRKDSMSEITEKLNQVRRRIEQARGRSPYGQDVTLVAVTKFHPLEAMEEAIGAGVTWVGENRVQEMEMKRARLTLPVKWTLQGHLQRNKVKKAVQLSDLIQSVDSEGILRDIDRRAGEAGKVQDILLEFNISGEESKYGLASSQAKDMLSLAMSLPSVCVRGMMCMAPVAENPETVRGVFKQGKALFDALGTSCDTCRILSMGMTQDFEVAIEEGATMVRIGTAIFGQRK